jgi:hypothetical protein
MTGTAHQALKFSMNLNNGMHKRFLTNWLEGKDVSHWRIPTETAKDTSSKAAKTISFADFCDLNPEPIDETVFDRFSAVFLSVCNSGSEINKRDIIDALDQAKAKIVGVK